MKDISRRDFLKGSVAAAAALGLTGIAPAFAEEAKTEEKEKLVPSSTVDCDAVVVGAGAAGLMAAMELAAAGKKTYLLEKGITAAVSNGSQAGGPALAETRVQAAEDATVSVETLYECEYGFSRGTVNGSLLRKCTAAGERVVSNFMDNGVNMGLRIDSYGMGFRARHNFANLEGTQLRGLDRFGPLIEKFEADGGVHECLREAVQLVKEGDAVTGVLVRNGEDKSIIQYNCKAVLIATGGYAGNDERLRQIFGDLSVWPLCNTLSTGQGFDMVLEAGGIADRNWALCCNEFGGANHKIPDIHGGAMRSASPALEPALYGGLIVNRNGDRFMNEQYLSDRGSVFFKGGENVVRADLPESVDAAVEQGWAAKGTLAECAAVFGMANLEKTVEEYNALCEAGEDTQFYKAPYLLHKLSGDTYYVFEYEPSIWSTFGGVKTDDYCRALAKDLSVIPGLYVAGVDNGSLYCSPYYENEGASLGIAYTSGIVAADCMLEFLNA